MVGDGVVAQGPPMLTCTQPFFLLNNLIYEIVSGLHVVVPLVWVPACNYHASCKKGMVPSFTWALGAQCCVSIGQGSFWAWKCLCFSNNVTQVSEFNITKEKVFDNNSLSTRVQYNEEHTVFELRVYLNVSLSFMYSFRQ